MPNIKFQEKFQNSFCKILKNKWYHATVLLKRFHFNGHTIGFRRQNQKLEIHYMSTLVVTNGKWNAVENFTVTKKQVFLYLV